MGANTSTIGARTEAMVAGALVRAGKDLYLPVFSAHSRIDLIFGDATGIYRVQCKTGQLRGEVLFFPTSDNTRNSRRSYRGDVDFFGVYSPDLDKVFLLPIDDVPDKACYLRLAPTRNNQHKGIRWAKDYRLG